jgi:hypothetical protein
MATNAGALLGTLSVNQVDSNIVKDGFGTVDAAIFVAANTIAGSEGNPQFGVTLYDVENSAASFSTFLTEYLSDPTEAAQQNTTSLMFNMIHGDGSVNWQGDINGRITDGVQSQYLAGNTGVNRRVGGLFLSGISNSNHQQVDLGSDSSAVSISLSFTPNLFFLTTTGNTDSSVDLTDGNLSFGIAHKAAGGTLTQASVIGHLEDNTASSSSKTYITDSAIGGIINNSTLDFTIALSDVSSGYTLTPSSNAGNKKANVLAIELGNPADFWMTTTNTAATASGSVAYSTPLTPEVVGVITTLASSFNETTSDAAIAFGTGDVSDQAAIALTSPSGQTSERGLSYGNDAATHYIRSDGSTTDSIAVLTSLNNDNFVLNWESPASNPYKTIMFAFGPRIIDPLSASAQSYVYTGNNLDLFADRLLTAEQQEYLITSSQIVAGENPTVALVGTNGGGDNMAGILYNGDIVRYTYDSVPTDLSEFIHMTVITPEFDGGHNNNKFMHKLEVMGTRIADTSGDQEMTIKWTNDRYTTWSPTKTIDTTKRPKIHRLGRFIRRAFQIDYQGPERQKLEKLQVLTGDSKYQ